MINKLSVVKSTGTDPYRNLAMEEYLLDNVRSGECILYLWQNQRTVVIGRNQNAGNECRISLLEKEGGHLARRLSGGGAVYHDLGNLNFTFIMPSDAFDTEKQTQVILTAVQGLGIAASKSGRNDLTVDGQKFSGHAFYHSGGKSYHHGTLMVKVDTSPLARYLNVSPLKLDAKGVRSVRSRVCNLTDWNPAVTIEGLSASLVGAFEEVYDREALPLEEIPSGATVLSPYVLKFSSPAWIYGNAKPMEDSRESRFDWGTVRIDFTVRNGIIEDAALWSDGLDADYLEEIPQMLRGVKAELESITESLCKSNNANFDIASDIASLIATTDR